MPPMNAATIDEAAEKATTKKRRPPARLALYLRARAGANATHTLAAARHARVVSHATHPCSQPP
eukprot:1160334-Prymnesium_polylepis.1